MRRDFKGQSQTDEHLRLLCHIRHEYTNYEKLAVFYKIYPKRRSELNAEINRLIKEGPDGIERFRKRVKFIENQINLNLKDVKKRFIEEEMKRIKEKYPHYMDSTIKKCAETVAARYIRENNEYITKTKRIRDDNTRINQ